MDVKMPVAPITSANSQLILVGMFFNHCALPQPSGALAVVGIYSLQPTKVAHLVLVLSSKLLPARADKETFQIGRASCRERDRTGEATVKVERSAQTTTRRLCT